MAYQTCKGTQLKFYTSGAYTAIPQCQVLTPNGSEIDIQETTDLDATAVTKKGTLADFGTVTAQIEWDPANAVHAALYTAHAAITESNFQIYFATTTPKTDSFTGTISKWAPAEFAPKGIAKVTIEIAISGAVTRA